MNFLSSLLGNLNYGTVFLLMLLESTVIPVPSELVVAPAAYHSAAGNLDVWLVIFFATLGADCGATINYLAGYYLGRPIIYRFANSRWGHFCMLNQKRWRKVKTISMTTAWRLPSQAGSSPASAISSPFLPDSPK